MSVDVPDEYQEFPFEAKRFVLAEANTAKDIRREIEAIVGLEAEDVSGRDASQFTKEQMAAILMALGGPQEGQ